MHLITRRLASQATVFCGLIVAVVLTGCSSTGAVKPIQVFKSPYQTNYPAFQTQQYSPQVFAAPAPATRSQIQQATGQPNSPWSWPSFKASNPFNFANRSC